MLFLCTSCSQDKINENRYIKYGDFKISTELNTEYVYIKIGNEQFKEYLVKDSEVIDLNANVNDTIEMQMYENEIVLYKWNSAISNNGIEKINEQHFIIISGKRYPKSDEPVIGEANTKAKFMFKVMKSGSNNLTFNYKYAGEEERVPGFTFMLNVNAKTKK